MFNITKLAFVGTSRWGEYGEGGLLWSECSGKPFEWFDGIPIEELLCKVCIFAIIILMIASFDAQFF